MPLILGTNSIKDTGYDVANSCRFNSGSSDHLTRSLGASETSTRIATWSFWVKRGNLGSYNIYSNEVEDDNNRGYFQFNADQLRMVDEAGTGTELKATQVFRDVSAWYHIVIAMDTTQSTSTNRVKWYVNGNQISIDATTTFPPQNTDQKILIGGQTNKNHIGKIHPSGGEFDGYDGPTTVGEYRRNPWGFYDMHGNVWEWTADWYQAAYLAANPSFDPEGPASGLGRVLRGGSWASVKTDLRSANRSVMPPTSYRHYIGFRVGFQSSK